MAAPVVFFYAAGILAFIIGIEEKEAPNNIIYMGAASLFNLMAYYLSYTNTDYTEAAYMPLVLAILSVVMVFYKAWEMIPVPKSWDAETDSED